MPNHEKACGTHSENLKAGEFPIGKLNSMEWKIGDMCVVSEQLAVIRSVTTNRTEIQFWKEGDNVLSAEDFSGPTEGMNEEGV